MNLLTLKFMYVFLCHTYKIHRIIVNYEYFIIKYYLPFIISYLFYKNDYIRRANVKVTLKAL